VTVSARPTRDDRILNLCFHGIGTPGRELEPDEDLIWVQEQQFDELLDVIANYPHVRITFDDGNASDAAIALPALRKRGLVATFFVISGRLDQAGSLSSADARDLVSEGMTVGSHGMRHRPWRSLDEPGFHEELVVAPDAIASVTGQPVREAACPFGSYDRRVLRALRRTSLQRVYTVDGGSARRDAWLQSRYTVRASDTPADLERRAQDPRGGAVSAAIRSGKSFIKRWR
jgi:peptidoglycan/xylan/chitin deacetylase (PgdA/CDA1 family)